MSDFNNGAGGRRLDVKVVHEPPRANEAEPHAAWRLVPSVEDILKRGYSFALIADPYFQRLHRGIGIDEELSPAAAGIAKGVTGQFGYGRRDPRLVLPFKAQHLGDAPSPLPDRNNVAFRFDRNGDNRPALVGCCHRRHHLQTSTVASSRPRLKSR